MLLDADGRPLRPAILQNDARAGAEVQELEAAIDHGVLLSATGSVLSQQSVAPTALWLARHYGIADKLEITPLFETAEALEQGGTSFDALYVNVNGASGYFERSLNAYGRQGLPCRRCGALMRREAFMNRSSFSCPRCQVRPRHPAP